jgi:hypothetical protein
MWDHLYNRLTAAEALGVGRTRPHLNSRAQRILNYLRARKHRLPCPAACAAHQPL